MDENEQEVHENEPLQMNDDERRRVTKASYMDIEAVRGWDSESEYSDNCDLRRRKEMNI